VRDLTPETSPALLRGLMASALLGSAASLLALFSALAGMGTLSTWHAAVMLICGTVTLSGLLVLQLSAQGRLPGREVKKLLWEGSPRWLRWLTTAVILASLALWLGIGLGGYEPPGDGLSSLIAGALGLLVFPAAFTQAWSCLRRRDALNRRCSNGHQVPLGARFCPSCGEPVGLVD